MENVRTSILAGAEKVILVARRANIVVMAFSMYLMFLNDDKLRRVADITLCVPVVADDQKESCRTSREEAGCPGGGNGSRDGSIPPHGTRMVFPKIGSALGGSLVPRPWDQEGIPDGRGRWVVPTPFSRDGRPVVPAWGGEQPPSASPIVGNRKAPPSMGNHHETGSHPCGTPRLFPTGSTALSPAVFA